MPQQKIAIKINKNHGPDARELIALDIVRFIQKRTARGLDKNNNAFPMVPLIIKQGRKMVKNRDGKYSVRYVESREFKAARKNKSNLNLKLTGEMLSQLEVLKITPGEIVVGYDAGNKELNGKVEGNIKGTYGDEGRAKRYPRDFLGIDNSTLRSIQSRYDKEKVDLEAVILAKAKAAEGASKIRKKTLEQVQRRIDRLENEN